MTDRNEDQLLTAKQVAERLQVSKQWVHDHSSGRRLPVLPSVKMGGTLRFDPKEIDQFVEHCKRHMAEGKPIPSMPNKPYIVEKKVAR